MAKTYSRTICPGAADPDAVVNAQRADADGAAQDNLLFRWFVGLELDEPVGHPTVFNKNRNRRLEGAVEEFFLLVVRQSRTQRLLSDEHLTIHGTLIEAWAAKRASTEERSRRHLQAAAEGSGQ